MDVGFLEEVVSDAKVFDRGRKGDVEWAADVGELGEGSENPGCEGDIVAEVSDAADCDRPEIGTIRFWMFWVEACGESGESGLVHSSCGISSAAGMGRPLPAATS